MPVPRVILPPHQRGVVAMALAVAMLSAGSTLVKWTETSGAVLAAWRLALAAVLWWAVIVVQHRRRGTPYPSRHAWRAALPAGLCFGADLALFFTALTRTSIAHAEFIGSMTPLLVVPLGMVVFGERPNLMALPFGLVTLAGLAAFISTGGSGGAATTGGDLLAVLALMCWAAYLAFSRRARATVGVTDFMATVLPIGLVVALPAALV
jgi:drug/metabolite transporter (DMT)-like permease